MNSFDFKRALGQSLGLEEFDVDINIGTEVEVDDTGAPLSGTTPAGTLTPEAAEVEMNEESTEAGDVSEEIDEVEDDIEALESYKQILTKSLRRGGMNTASFEMFQVSTKRIYKKYGIDATEVYPSMESFSYDQEDATRVSLEKIEISLETLSDVAGDAWKRFVQAIRNFFKTIWEKMSPALIHRAKRALSLVKNTKDSEWTKTVDIERTEVAANKPLAYMSGSVEDLIKQVQDSAYLQKEIMDGVAENTMNRSSFDAAKELAEFSEIVTQKRDFGFVAAKDVEAIFARANPDDKDVLKAARVRLDKHAKALAKHQKEHVKITGFDRNNTIKLLEATVKQLEEVIPATKNVGKVMDTLSKVVVKKDDESSQKTSKGIKAKITIANLCIKHLMSAYSSIIDVALEARKSAVKKDKNAGPSSSSEKENKDGE